MPPVLAGAHKSSLLGEAGLHRTPKAISDMWVDGSVVRVRDYCRPLSHQTGREGKVGQ